MGGGGGRGGGADDDAADDDAPSDDAPSGDDDDDDGNGTTNSDIGAFSMLATKGRVRASVVGEGVQGSKCDTDVCVQPPRK